jgi:hypothetical protein
MRIFLAMLFIVVGVAALIFRSITFFGSERAVNGGIFSIDVAQPHTIYLNPIVGIVCLVVGILLLMMGRRSAID